MSTSHPLPDIPGRDGERPLMHISMPDVTFSGSVIHHSAPPLPSSWDGSQYQNRPRPRVLSMNAYPYSAPETPYTEPALNTPIAFPQPYGGEMPGLVVPPRLLSQSRSVGELSRPHRASIPARHVNSEYPSDDKREFEVRHLSFACVINAKLLQFRDSSIEKLSSGLAESKQVSFFNSNML